ncbi:MAG: PD-(D/E)XK nuclease family protein, partial [Cyanobacteria bacterium J06649_4]
MQPLSQSHLTIFDTCPRRYQHVFFDALSAPASYEHHAKTQWGSQFHLLMQQQALDLPVDAIAPADSAMAASL